MKNVLAVIDMQNDFIDGSLGTPEAPLTVPAVVREIENPAYDGIIATMDTHHENYMETLEGKKLPVMHCIKGTDGWQIRPEILAALEARNAEIIEKPTFGSIALAERLAAEKPESITLCGLCTDICVLSNAILLRAYLKDTVIRVIAAGCAATTPEKHQATLAVLNSCQIEVC